MVYSLKACDIARNGIQASKGAALLALQEAIAEALSNFLSELGATQTINFINKLTDSAASNPFFRLLKKNEESV